MKWEWVNDCGLRSRCGRYMLCRVPSRGVYELWLISGACRTIVETHWRASTLFKVAELDAESKHGFLNKRLQPLS